MFVFPWPDDPVFYIAIAAGSLMFTYGDLVVFGLIARDGAGVVSRIEPLSSWDFVFSLDGFNAGAFGGLFGGTFAVCGDCGGFDGVCFFSRCGCGICSVSWGVIKRILPVLFTGALGLSTSKIAMDRSGLHEGVFYYTFVQSGDYDGFVWSVIAV